MENQTFGWMATAGPTDLPLLIKELNAALIDEIKGKNRGEGGKKVRIFNGELKEITTGYLKLAIFQPTP